MRPGIRNLCANPGCIVKSSFVAEVPPHLSAFAIDFTAAGALGAISLLRESELIGRDRRGSRRRGLSGRAGKRACFPILGCDRGCWRLPVSFCRLHSNMIPINQFSTQPTLRPHQNNAEDTQRQDNGPEGVSPSKDINEVE